MTIKIKNISILFIVITFLLYLGGCNPNSKSLLTTQEKIENNQMKGSVCLNDSDIDANQLLNMPSVANIGGKDVFFDTYIWKNFQPKISASEKIQSSNSNNFVSIIVRIKTVDKTPLPDNLVPDRIWLVKNGTMVSSVFSDEIRPHRNHWSMEKVARNLFFQDEGMDVHVVIKLIENGNHYFLKASDQKISHTF